MNLTPREQADVEAALGLAVAPVEPSAGLKASIMAKLAETPQLPAIPTNGGSLPAEAAEAAEAEVADESSSGAQIVNLQNSRPGSAQHRAQARWFTRPVTVLVAAAAAVLLFVGGTVVGTQFSAPNPVDTEAQSLAVLTGASDLQRATTEVSGGGEATLVWSLDQRKSAILVNDLPSLPGDKTYQLWYIGEGGAIPAGTFASSASATSWRVLDGQMSAGDTVGVTVEPTGGSEQPTTEPILKISS